MKRVRAYTGGVKTTGKSDCTSQNLNHRRIACQRLPHVCCKAVRLHKVYIQRDMSKLCSLLDNPSASSFPAQKMLQVPGVTSQASTRLFLASKGTFSRHPTKVKRSFFRRELLIFHHTGHVRPHPSITGHSSAGKSHQENCVPYCPPCLLSQFLRCGTNGSLTYGKSTNGPLWPS